MGQKCEICSKTVQTGNRVSHANNRTKRRWLPNLKKVRVQISAGVNRTMRLCTRCIRTGKLAKSV